MPSIKLTPEQLKEKLETLQNKLQEQLNAAEQDIPAIIETYLELAATYSDEKDYAAAITQLETALPITRAEGVESNTKQEAEVLYELAVALHRQHEDFGKAMEYALQALELFEQNHFNGNLAKAYQRIGLIHVSESNWEAALDALEKSADWAEQLEDWEELGGTYATIADVYRIKNEFQEALEYYKSAIENYEKCDANEYLGTVYQIIAEILAQHNKQEQALKCYNEAAFYYGKAACHDEAGITNVYAGKLLIPMRKYDLAIELLLAAVAEFTQADNPFEVTNSYIQIAGIYEEQKQWQKAIEIYEQALPFAQSAADEVLLDTVLESMEHAKELNETQSTVTSSSDEAKSGGFFNKLKGFFGG